MAYSRSQPEGYYILHVTSWEFAPYLCQILQNLDCIKPLQHSSCTASQLKAVSWTINTADVSPFQEGTYVHFTSDLFRIPQMLPVPSCSHTGKSLNNDVNLSFMVTLLLQTLKELCNVVLFFICLNALKENTVGHCVIKSFGFPHTKWVRRDRGNIGGLKGTCSINWVQLVAVDGTIYSNHRYFNEGDSKCSE